MVKAIKTHRLDTVFALIIFCVFTASVLMVLMLGGITYRNIVEKSNEEYDEHICLSYIWTKIKNTDESGKVYVGDFCGISALFLEEEYDRTVYRTVIYLYDGWVCELFSEAGLEFFPEDGMSVVKCEALTFDMLEDSLIRVEVKSGSMLISPRCKSGISFSGGAEFE